MATRSLIGVEFPPTADGRHGIAVRSAYCHLDGQISHNGKLLLTEHNNVTAALAIVGAGYISALTAGETILEAMAKSYNHEPPIDSASIEQFFSDGWDIGAQYFYLWRSGAWHVAKPANKRFVLLTQQMIDDIAAYDAALLAELTDAASQG